MGGLEADCSLVGGVEIMGGILEKLNNVSGRTQDHGSSMDLSQHF